jgi:isoleucyl-tRNA synthetase
MAATRSEPAPAAPSLAEVERRVLAYWDATGVPGRALPGVPGGPVFRFTDGPMTANGAPHLGHVVSRVLKDVQLRYRRMTGHAIVSSMGGWDCHGLPVELEIEKAYGLKSRKEIEAFGVERFCDACRASVRAAVSLFEEMSRRLGYWLDYAHAYETMSPSYIESVWWSLKTLFDHGLLEKGFYCLPYCPRCETPLSSHEVAQGYRETTDPSIAVRFRVRGPAGSPPRFLLVWTTTPWTLPANLLVAARSDLDYVAVRAEDGSEYLLAETARPRFLPEAEVVGRWPGAELLGLEYEPIFPFAGPGPGRYRVVLDPMVEATEGTGFVHIAPSFGPDDQRVGEREGVGFFDPLDSRGRFTGAVPPVEGRFFKAADPVLLESLRTEGVLVHRDAVRHTYPFCWRCDTPLLYRALDSWFVRTSRFSDRLRAYNATVQWIPAHLRDGRFGNFLTEAKDWALSRNRYWGTPLPIWRCPAGHFTCVGSLAELGERVGRPLPAEFDPHRVQVDPLTFPCATCRAPATREPYTIDGWYDSGAAPFAQYHYPFASGPFVPSEPLDYIAEGLDQTRGWFYTLLVLATALFDRPAYRVCVTNGLLLDTEGRKMSKSRGNAVEPLELLRAQGGDAVRWSFLVSDFTEPMRVGDRTIREQAGRTVTTLLNVAQFHLSNARADGLASERRAPASPHLLDRWLLSRADALVEAVDRSLASSDPRPGALALREFVDDLSTWYLRRSRPRFWAEAGSSDRQQANATLSFTLGLLARLLAPYAPFTAEFLHQEVHGLGYETAEASVHLGGWPQPPGRRDVGLEAAMADLRGAVEVGRELRQRAQVKSRIPLPALLRFAAAPEPFEALGPDGIRLLTDELNVVEYRRVDPASLRDFGPADWVVREAADGSAWALSRAPTPALRREGLVREALRRFQLRRKELGLAFTDRVVVDVVADPELREALEAAAGRIADELLADRFDLVERAGGEADGWRSWEVAGLSLAARLVRSAP